MVIRLLGISACASVALIACSGASVDDYECQVNASGKSVAVFKGEALNHDEAYSRYWLAVLHSENERDFTTSQREQARRTYELIEDCILSD